MQNLQFDRRPHTVPGTRVDAIDKRTQKMQENRLDPLAQRRDQRLGLASDSIRRSQQEYLTVIPQLNLQSGAAISQISQATPAGYHLCQCGSRIAATDEALSENRSASQSVLGHDGMLLEVKAPTFLGIAEPCAVFTRRAPPPLTQCPTNRNRQSRCRKFV